MSFLPKYQNIIITQGFVNLRAAMRLQGVRDTYEIMAGLDGDEEINPYCPACGSCGETGCCPPTMCQTVKCHYPDANLQDFKTQQREWDIMHKTLVGLFGPRAVDEFLSSLEEINLEGK